MNIQFDVLRKSRELVLKELEGLTLDQIHKIPEGFKNNIAWNVAHLVVTQQLLHYKLSGLNPLCPDDLIEAHRKGTSPTKIFTEEEFEEVKDLLMALPDTLQEDFEAGIFENYTEYPTSTGYVLSSIENAISFNNFHEGIHYGIIRSIKKFL
ncbi:damage-inducible protein DinB [Polaribacter reichenbachii]|uniref:Damage-inducible protein DinB n=1 Tax=Polaribacter reichenbachii TaxID=996801 RepID=A0A1B8U6E9_9FLAO|nr:DinB family protein [Polaribacter reichenbachii]APZ46171.1 damage-inducible protein DinB [Polaribacter reichenbachii]AUC20033.1 damage-inducible protein DinB [Polaribacter reichenbachii]OBY67420.1 damage-inducible protein DinB [Polaribacter reichenbachii]